MTPKPGAFLLLANDGFSGTELKDREDGRMRLEEPSGPTQHSLTAQAQCVSSTANIKPTSYGCCEIHVQYMARGSGTLKTL